MPKHKDQEYLKSHPDMNLTKIMDSMTLKSDGIYHKPEFKLWDEVFGRNVLRCTRGVQCVKRKI